MTERVHVTARQPPQFKIVKVDSLYESKPYQIFTRKIS
jgi:hypothetical protein